MLARRFVIVSLISSVVGCSQAPSRVQAPDWDPDGFADAVLAKLDANGDGSLDKAELSGAPGLAFGAKFIDSDKNQKLSREELIARFDLYRKMRLGVTSKQLRLSYNGRPLRDAKIELVPEFFLANVIETATGKTFDDGTVDPLVANLDPAGLRVGYYRVVVESPTVKIPVKYGSPESTPLGVEISPVSDDPNTYGTIQLILRE